MPIANLLSYQNVFYYSASIYYFKSQVYSDEIIPMCVLVHRVKNHLFLCHRETRLPYFYPKCSKEMPHCDYHTAFVTTYSLSLGLGTAKLCGLSIKNWLIPWADWLVSWDVCTCGVMTACTDCAVMYGGETTNLLRTGSNRCGCRVEKSVLYARLIEYG